ncbi:hypothetical protein Pelo_15024 [Pelomyxa schiedti]|nr:hypothetical protein Pelo_15024 [Pelomyxa schiedti]
MVDPCGTPCQHLFCKQCILQCLSRKSECPIDRLPLTVEQVKPNPLAVSLLENAQVFCAQKQRGCTWTGTLASRKAHVKVCQFIPVECTIPNCGKVFDTRQGLERHMVADALEHVRLLDEENKDLRDQVAPIKGFKRPNYTQLLKTCTGKTSFFMVMRCSLCSYIHVPSCTAATCYDKPFLFYPKTTPTKIPVARDNQPSTSGQCVKCGLCQVIPTFLCPTPHCCTSVEILWWRVHAEEYEFLSKETADTIRIHMSPPHTIMSTILVQCTDCGSVSFPGQCSTNPAYGNSLCRRVSLTDLSLNNEGVATHWDSWQVTHMEHCPAPANSTPFVPVPVILCAPQLLRLQTGLRELYGTLPGEAPPSLTASLPAMSNGFPTPTRPMSISVLPELELPEGWQEAVDAKGRIYYFNRTTKQTQWAKPGKKN